MVLDDFELQNNNALGLETTDSDTGLEQILFSQNERLCEIKSHEDLITKALPDDILKNVFTKLPSSHRFISPVSRTFRNLYELSTKEEFKNKTHTYSISSEPALDIYLDEAKYCRFREMEASRVGAGAGQIGFIEKSGKWNQFTPRDAANKGQLHVLKWLRERGCPWDEWTCYWAAHGGHLKILQWVREEGCPWDWQTCNAAAWENNLDVLKWAIENGCPYHLSSINKISDPCFVEWFEAHRKLFDNFSH